MNLVHAFGDDRHPIDYRVYAPDADGKTKNDHFREMLRLAFEEKRVQAQTILFDNWYASSENIKYIHRLEKFFITSLKENRLISLSKESGLHSSPRSAVDRRATPMRHHRQTQGNPV